jgi:F-type H+-transporting ATPase subunit gamma
MAKPRAILKRSQSIKNIAKITNTMYKIAAAKFKRAHDRAVAARPYTDKLTRLIGDLARAAGDSFDHPLLQVREPKKALVIGIASNRGLCGGYNGNIARLVTDSCRDIEKRGVELHVLASGSRLISMLKHRKVKPDREITHIEDKPTFEEVDAISMDVLDLYARGEVEEVFVVYTKFESASRQAAVCERVLPLETPDAEEGAVAHSYIFHPSAEGILSDLLPKSVRLHIFQAFLDAAVSEQTARRMAMKNATDSAEEIIKDLTMLYNRSRQTQITTELSEIIGGAAALE